MRFALILCCLLTVNMSSVHAETSSRRGVTQKSEMSPAQIRRWQRSLTQYTGYYDEALDSIRRGSENFDYDVERMRSYYVQSEYYTPFSKGVVDELSEYAYTIDTSEDQVEINEAYAAYQELVWAHLVNLDVLTFALSMSSLDARYGDGVLFKKVRRALLKSILWEGAKCDAPDQACRIVSYGEETYILGKIGGILKQSKIYKVNGQYYNVHDLIKDGVGIQVYMNVTAPIVNVLKTQAVLDSNMDVSLHPQ